MAASQCLQLSSILNSNLIVDKFGLQIICILTGNNENPVLADLTIPAYQIYFDWKPNTNESSIQLSCFAINDLINDISNRSNGEIYVYLNALYGTGSTISYKNFVYNFQNFDYSEGPRSKSIVLNGTKSISSSGNCNYRTINYYFSKTKRPQGSETLLTYQMGVLDALNFHPEDVIYDGVDTSIVYSISYTLQPDHMTCSIESKQ